MSYVPEKKDWIAVQSSSFTRWANSYLSQRGLTIQDPNKDFADGILLINLLEILSDKKLPRYNKNPRLGVQRIANLNIALDFMKESGLKMVNIGPEDIERGNLKIILGLLWTIILRFQIQKFSSADGKEDQVAGAFGMEFETPVVHSEDSSKAMLLKFVNEQVQPYGMPEVRNFTTAFTDGKVLMALCDSMAPGTLDMASMSDPLSNASLAIGTAEREFGIPVLLDAVDVVSNPNEQSMMAYVSFYQNFKVTHQFHVKKKQTESAARSEATPGVVAVETKHDSQQAAILHDFFSPELFQPLAPLPSPPALMDSSSAYRAPTVVQPWLAEFAAEEVKEPLGGYGYDDAELKQEEKIAHDVQQEFMRGLQIADVIGYQLAIQDNKKKRYELCVGCTGLTKMGYVGRSNPMVGLFETDAHGNLLLVDFTEWLTDDHDPVFSKSFVVRFNNDASDRNKSYRLVVWHVASRDIEEAARVHAAPKVTEKNVIGYADFLLSKVLSNDAIGEILKLPLDASTPKQEKKLKAKHATVSIALRRRGLRIAHLSGVTESSSRKGNRVEVRVTVLGQRGRNPMVAIFERQRGVRTGEMVLLGHTEWIRMPTNEQTFSKNIVLYETGKDNASRWLRVCLYNVTVPEKEVIRSTQGQLSVTSSEHDLVGTRDITMQELLVALQQGNDGLSYPFFGAGKHAGKGNFILRGRTFEEVKEVQFVGVSHRITNTFIGHEVEFEVKCANLYGLDMHSPCNPVVALFEKDQKGDYHLEGQTEWLKSEHNPVFASKFNIYNVLSDEREYRLNVYDVDVDAFAEQEPGKGKRPIVSAMDGNLCSERALVGIGFVSLQALLMKAALGQPLSIPLQSPQERQGKPDNAFTQRRQVLADKKSALVIGVRIYHAVCAENIQKQSVQQDFRQLGSVPRILYLGSKLIDQTGHEVRLSFSASRLPKFDWWSRGNPFVVLLEKCNAKQTQVVEQLQVATWDCPACTYKNPATFLACEMCASQRPIQFNSLSAAPVPVKKEAVKTEWKVLAQTEWVPNTPDPIFKRQIVVCYDHDSDKELRIAVYDASSNKPPTFDALVGFVNVRLSKIVEMADGLPCTMDLSSERPGAAELIRSKHSTISVTATLGLVNDDRRRALPKPGSLVRIASVQAPLAVEGRVDKELLITLGAQRLLKLFWPARAPMIALLKESSPNNFDVLLQQTEWFECHHSACVFQTALRVPLERDLSKVYRFALFDVGSEVLALREMIGHVDITLQQMAEEAVPFRDQFINADEASQRVPEWQFRLQLQSSNPQLHQMLQQKGTCLNFLVQQRTRVQQNNMNVLSLLGFE